MHDIFGTPLYQKNIGVDESVANKAKELYKKTELDIPSGWQTNKCHTTFSSMSETYKIISREYISNYQEEFFNITGLYNDINGIWINCYGNGEYQELHNHIDIGTTGPSNDFSCIHFLNFDKDKHKPVVFFDPIEKLRALTYHTKPTHYAPDVSSGDLLIFPSYLDHYVPVSDPTPDNPRITVSFNIKIV